jgi:hypothetical protein
MYYANGDCNESEEPAEDGEGGTGGGGGGGGSGSGGGGTCTLWRVDVYESADGGETWTYEGSYYYWECTP